MIDEKHPIYRFNHFFCRQVHSQDAKKLLTIAYNQHNYDFENRFSAQIQRDIKSLQC